MKVNLKNILIQPTYVLIVTTFMSVLGATYAYFLFEKSNTDVINGTAATVNLSLDVERIFPEKENTGVLVPQKSVSASNSSPLATALKNGCVDGNKNVICQVYKINIKNDGGKATEVVDGKASFYTDAALTENSVSKMPNLSWKLITSIDKQDNNNSVLGTNADNQASSTPLSFVNNLTLKTNDEYTYYMIIWINEINQDQTDKSNTFYGKIEFSSSNGTGVTSAF